MYAIRTEGLTKRYGDLVALDDLDLQVRVGEVFGFLGPNGAGKSTTIKCLLDLIKPTSGTASVLDRSVATDSIEIRRSVGFVPGDLALYPKLTGREVIDYLANIRGGVDPTRINELAERFGADLSRRCGEYSSGNRQKVGLIQAFMHNPDLVILDEPSTGLDPLVQQEMQDLILETVADGRTVFLSSHTLSEVDRVADRVGIIRSGKLIEVASVSDLKARATRRLLLELEETPGPRVLAAVPGVTDVEDNGRIVTVTYDGPIEPILLAAGQFGIRNLQTLETDLEDIFLTFYRETTTVSDCGTDEAGTRACP